jgi:hypothetical protein
VAPPKQYNGSDLSAVSSNYNDSAVSGMSAAAEDQNMMKKKGNFFQSHSPFRRKSTKEKQVPPMPAQQISQSVATTPTSRNTWTPATVRKPDSAGSSPTKPFGNAPRSSPWNRPTSMEPEPVDPRAEYQLGIGGNVFDVASPDSRKKATPQKPADAEHDPIAQALAELKGVAKQASVRQSADRHYGMSTPVPGTPATSERNLPAGAVPTAFANNSFRDAPPPAYDTPVSRLGAPQPAHTSREMRKTTEQYTNQKREVFNAGAARPTSSVGRPSPQLQQKPQHEPPRAASPAPARSASPRPLINAEQRQPQPPPMQQQQQQPIYRSTSPNPYSAAAAGAPRPRAQSSGPAKPQAPFAASSYSRGNSPSFAPGPPRAASPNPAYAPANPANNHQPRPLSSRGPAEAPMGGSPGGGAPMALQLAPVPSSGPESYGGQQQRTGRPQSQYYAPTEHHHSSANNQVGAPRARSQSVAGQRQVTKGGIPILHYGQ